MLGLGSDLEGHDGQGRVDEADAQAHQKPPDEGHPHGNRGGEEGPDGDRADRHQRATDDWEPTSHPLVVDARLPDCANRPGDRTEGDPPGGGCLGPAVHTLEDERNHDGETDL